MKDVKKLLVVVDAQGGFTNGLLGNEDCYNVIPAIGKRIKEAQAENIAISKTLDTHVHGAYEQSVEATHIPIHTEKGTEEWKVDARIRDLIDGDDVATFEKDAFGSVDLALYIKENGFTDVEFIGMDTDFCVISCLFTAMAHNPNVKFVINAACCAGSSKEYHDKALDMAEHCFAIVINK